MRLGRKRRGPATVAGVVYPPGAGGIGLGDGWILSFELKPWRRAGEGLEERALSLSKPVSEAELQRFMDAIRPYDVVRAEVELEGRGKATLLELAGGDDDAELTRRAEELRKPVTVEDDVFGTFVFDRDVDVWEAEHSWAGTPVRLSVSAGEHDDLRAASAPARALWQSEAEWDRRVRARAIDELLPLKNEHWREDGEPEVTAAQFEARLTLESISVTDDLLEFWFDDGELFLGHTICVAGTLADGPTETDIVG
jgi:hypothetical protein